MRFLIYLFPAMMDLVLGCLFFVCTQRAADAQGSATASGGVIASWSLAYMLIALVAGRVVTPRNAAALLVASCGLTLALAGAFVLIPDPDAIYPLIVLQAAASAFFFCPFQVFMKAVEKGRPQGVVRSTALYTFAWSAGMAAGPFVAGFIFQTADWRWCHAVNAALALFTAAGVMLLKHHAHASDAFEGEACRRSADSAELRHGTRAELGHGTAEDYSGRPSFAWLGWVAAGVGCLVVSLIRAVFIQTGNKLQLDQFTKGVTLAILSAVQAVVGLLLIFGRTWMYRPLCVGAFGAAGVTGLILFAVGRNAEMFYLAAALFGVYSGGFFFYLVFHSLVHPTRSARYVAINEAVVGITGVAGPLVGGALMDAFGLGAPYFASAAITVAAVAVQVVVHWVQRARA